MKGFDVCAAVEAVEVADQDCPVKEVRIVDCGVCAKEDYVMELRALGEEEGEHEHDPEGGCCPGH